MPKLPWPPRSAQNSSGSLAAVTVVELAIGRDELDRAHMVGGEAVPAGEVPHAAAERVADDAHARRGPGQREPARAGRRRR